MSVPLYGIDQHRDQGLQALAAYLPDNPCNSEPGARCRLYSYDELIALDTASLDAFLLTDDSLAKLAGLTLPDAPQQEIIDHREAALAASSTVVVNMAKSTAVKTDYRREPTLTHAHGSNRRSVESAACL